MPPLLALLTATWLAQGNATTAVSTTVARVVSVRDGDTVRLQRDGALVAVRLA